MLSKKKKIFILVGMVALLVVTGCLNIFLNKKATTPGNNTVTYASFFDSYRADRTTTREQTILTLDAIITNPASSEEAIRNAENAKQQIADNMETELVLEGLIKALGFQDAVVTNSTDYINVIVKAASLEETQSTQILEIVVSETAKDPIYVRIIPVE